MLYPEVRRNLEATYSLHGHLVRFATVDLARPWREIELRLSSLLVYKPSAAASSAPALRSL